MKRSNAARMMSLLFILSTFTLQGCKEMTNKEHEAITICAPGRNIKDFIDVVHKTYPEINFKVDAYNGYNATDYMVNQFKTDNLADIYSCSYYLGDQFDLSGKLVDLSKYDFTGNYVPARIREVNENGSVYLLPNYYSAMGITYNKKILKENGWSLPKSFEELKELAPKVKEKGYNLALNEVGLPGYGFQYFCNILDTDYLSTVAGKKWQSDFLAGKTDFTKDEKMKKATEILDEWRDIGMLNGDTKDMKDTEVCSKMAEGNTLFLLGMTNTVEAYGANVEDFGLMPYLSMDGKQNVYILQVTRFMGLNKKLEQKGNEQKLQDALHVMEILSTNEGMEALNKSVVNTYISPLKDASSPKSNFYHDIMTEINEGFTAPFIYSGWDNVIVEYGNEMISYFCGEKSLDEAIEHLNDTQHLITDEPLSYTTVTEMISTEGCAKLVGIAFAKATDSDLSLVSVGGMNMDTGDTNSDGVNGKLFPMKIGKQECCSIVPTGWHGKIRTITLTGKRVKELQQTGYDRKNRGYHFPYVLAKKEGMEIQDDKTYKVSICGVTDDVSKEGNLIETDVVGLTALEDYIKQFDTLKESDILWK